MYGSSQPAEKLTRDYSTVASESGFRFAADPKQISLAVHTRCLSAECINDANALRQKTNFPSRFNLIWAVQSCPEKYSAFLIPQITSIFRAVSSHLRGGSRSSRTR